MNEIQAAAERLARSQLCVKDCKHLWNAHRQCQWCHSMQRDVDVMEVSKAYLAEHPADDGDAIERDFLESIRQNGCDAGTFESSYGVIVDVCGNENPRVAYIGHSKLSEVSTRGELRALLKALKIDTKGGA